jgi:hypothetical protein
MHSNLIEEAVPVLKSSTVHEIYFQKYELNKRLVFYCFADYWRLGLVLKI